MTPENIIGYNQTSRARSMIIDVVPVPGIDGQLRITAIQRDDTVRIEIVPLGEYLDGDWEMGLEYRGTYPDLGTLITELELWLGTSRRL